MTNPIAEAIRYREQAKKAIGDLGRATHDGEDTSGRLAWVALGQLWYLAGALLDERKQSLQPPAEKRGEAPIPAEREWSPWERDLYYENRDLKAVLHRALASTPFDDGEPWEQRAQELLRRAPVTNTHSPPPSREGERKLEDDLTPKFMARGVECWLTLNSYGATWRAIDADIAAVLAAMPEERRDSLLKPWADAWRDRWVRFDLREAEQRAEAAEARLAELEERHDVERETWHATNVRHAGELEAARARVGELESVLRAVDAELPAGRAWTETEIRVARIFRAPDAKPLEPAPAAPTPASTFAAVADALPTNAEDERIVDALMAQRTVKARALADAPTPAVVGYAGKPELWVVEIDELDEDGQPLNEWFVPNREGIDGEGRAFSTREKAEAHAASGAEDVPGYRWRIVRYVPTKESPPRDSGGDPPDYVPGGKLVDAFGTRRHGDEQCKDPSEAEEAGAKGDRPVEPMPLGVPDETGGEASAGAGVVDALDGTVPAERDRGGQALRRLVPPGLTPEEAEERLSQSLDPDHEGLTQELYEDIQLTWRRFHKFEPWSYLDNDWREFLMRFREKAHSEGIKAAKAEVVTTLRPIIAGLDHLRGRFDSVFEALKRLEAMAAELEGAK